MLRRLVSALSRSSEPSGRSGSSFMISRIIPSTRLFRVASRDGVTSR